jgi:hypothetical protein
MGSPNWLLGQKSSIDSSASEQSPLLASLFFHLKAIVLDSAFKNIFLHPQCGGKVSSVVCHRKMSDHWQNLHVRTSVTAAGANVIKLFTVVSYDFPL